MTKEEKLTPEELQDAVERLAKVQAVRGYVVLGGLNVVEVGSIVHDGRVSGKPIGMPVRVVAETTFEDWKEQMAIGWPERIISDDNVALRLCNYYRVETD